MKAMTHSTPAKPDNSSPERFYGSTTDAEYTSAGTKIPDWNIANEEDAQRFRVKINQWQSNWDKNHAITRSNKHSKRR